MAVITSEAVADLTRKAAPNLYEFSESRALKNDPIGRRSRPSSARKSASSWTTRRISRRTQPRSSTRRHRSNYVTCCGVQLRGTPSKSAGRSSIKRLAIACSTHSATLVMPCSLRSTVPNRRSIHVLVAVKVKSQKGYRIPERRAAEGRVRLLRRAGELPRVGRDQLVRLPLPRRTYFRDHLEHVAETFAAVAERRDELPGYEIVDEPEMAELRHFSAELRPVE